jgi:hypothetical protein
MFVRSSLLLRTTPLWAVALVLCVSASAQAAKQLRWKLKAGDKIQYEVSAKTIIDNKGEMPFKMTQTQTVDSTIDAESVDADGTASIKQTVDRLQFKMEGPFGNNEIDSDSDEKPEGFAAAIADGAKAIAKQPVSLKANSRGEVSDITLTDEMSKKLEELSAAGGGLGAGMNADAVKQIVKQIWTVLPEKAVSVGDKWEETNEMASGPLGKMKIVTNYEYAGSEKLDGIPCEKITVTMTQEVVPDANAPLKVEIKNQENTGTLFFDAASGRMVSAELESKLEMALDFNGNKIESNTNTTTTQKLVTGDVKPKATKPATSKKEDLKKTETPDKTKTSGKKGDK